MYRSMEVGDTARVITPSDAPEYRLGTVTDVDHATPHTTYALRYTLRFPDGTERTYSADHVTRCTRTDDRAAIEEAFTTACLALRDACRIAHDFDADLSNGTASLLQQLVDLSRLHLGPILHSANPAWPHTHHQFGGRR